MPARDTAPSRERPAGLREHRPAGEPSVIGYPDDGNPAAPVTLVAMCACGSDYCRFVWTAYFPVHVSET